MKVLHLIDSLGFYGAETILTHLMVEQKKQGAEITLGSIGKHGIDEKEIETVALAKDIEVKKFRMRNGPNLLGAISLVQFARQSKFDIIHCHGYKANILIGMLPKFYRKIPYIVTMHGWTSLKRYSKMWLYAWADVLLAKRANMSVVVSKAMTNHPLIKAVSLETVVIHNGIPKPDMNRKSLGNFHNNKLECFCGKGFTVGAVGRLSPEKGYDILVNAVAKIINKGYDVCLVILGEGRTRFKLEKLVKENGIENRVLFPGYIGNANQYLKHFDIFVMSSLTEGLPVTLLEAMQVGIPIVATKVGGISEVLDNGGYGILVDSGDEHGLSEAITKLYNSQELRNQLSEIAKDRVNKKFSSKKMEHRYRIFYNNLIQTNNR